MAVDNLARRSCDEDEMVVHDEVVVDAADGVKNSVDLHQCFPDIYSTLVAFGHHERTQRYASYPGFFDLVVLKPAALSSDSANNDMVLSPP